MAELMFKPRGIAELLQKGFYPDVLLDDDRLEVLDEDKLLELLREWELDDELTELVELLDSEDKLLTLELDSDSLSSPMEDELLLDKLLLLWLELEFVDEELERDVLGLLTELLEEREWLELDVLLEELLLDVDILDGVLLEFVELESVLVLDELEELLLLKLEELVMLWLEELLDSELELLRLCEEELERLLLLDRE